MIYCMLMRSYNRVHLASTFFGAIAGALIVAIATRAIPKIMSQTMGGMMRNMMAQMGEAGCEPADM